MSSAYCKYSSLGFRRKEGHSLDHVEDGGVEVEPKVVIRDGHRLEGDRLGVLEEGVGSPDVLEPRHWQEAVLPSHVLWESKAMVFPTLCEEDVCCVRLFWEEKKRFLVMFVGQEDAYCVSSCREIRGLCF